MHKLSLKNVYSQVFSELQQIVFSLQWVQNQVNGNFKVARNLIINVFQTFSKKSSHSGVQTPDEAERH